MLKDLNLSVYQVENAVKVARALSAYIGGQIDPVVALCADTVVWRSVAEPEHAPFGGTFHGRDGVRAFFGLMFDSFEIFDRDVVDVIPAGDEVIHILKLEARHRDGRSGGSAFVVGRWRFQDGFVVAYTDYFDVPASVQTSTPAGANVDVTRDPSFAVYKIENAVRISEVLVAYRNGDVGPLFAILHPEVVWMSRSEPQHAMFGGVFLGHDAVKTYFQRLSENLCLVDYHIVDVIPAGHETLHVAEVSAHVAGDPARILKVRLVCFWSFKDGLVTAMTEYFDTPSYLAQRTRRLRP